jgi:signal transduction histidine kinase
LWSLWRPGYPGLDQSVTESVMAGCMASIDLAALTGEMVLARQAEAELRGLAVTTSFGPAPALGDARLAERLIANLVDNAVRHNVVHGVIQVSTSTWAGRAVLSVSNTGPVIAPEHLAGLFQQKP